MSYYHINVLWIISKWNLIHWLNEGSTKRKYHTYCHSIFHHYFILSQIMLELTSSDDIECKSTMKNRILHPTHGMTRFLKGKRRRESLVRVVHKKYEFPIISLYFTIQKRPKTSKVKTQLDRYIYMYAINLLKR